MNEDKISLTKEIKFKIITPENLMELIDVIYEDYQKKFNLFAEKREEKEPQFTITLLKPDGESTETKDYKKLKEEKKLYNTKYEGIRVGYSEGKEENKVEFSLMMQPDFFRREAFFEFWNNGIRISGKNEEWVRSRYDKINRIVSDWKDQCKLFREYEGYFSIFFIAFWAGVIGGAIYILLKFLHMTDIWFFLGIVGFVLAIVLGLFTEDKISKYFPSIELLTGPDHLHFEDEKRKKINSFIITIVVPFVFVLIGSILTYITKTT